MWYRCDGTYTILMGTPRSRSVTTPTVHFNDILQRYCYIQIEWYVFELECSWYGTTLPDLNSRRKQVASEIIPLLNGYDCVYIPETLWKQQ